MVIKYNFEINNNVVEDRFMYLINQIYKLLPLREESKDWVKSQENILEEFYGMRNLTIKNQEIFFPLLCKLEGLSDLKEDKDFLLFRRTIFECLNLCSKLKGELCQD